VTVDSLVAEYKAGTGMGELFAEYGKPEITGVGQVRNGTKKKRTTARQRVKINDPLRDFIIGVDSSSVKRTASFLSGMGLFYFHL
jgi:hypothetical protein